mgnify:CR=1 FL=1
MIHEMAGRSKPRAATSVANNTPRVALVKESNVEVRSACGMFPWSRNNCTTEPNHVTCQVSVGNQNMTPRFPT